MKRSAIFVDAGYLYAQGSACLQGSKAKRENIKLDHQTFIALLKTLVEHSQPNAPLLRIYWYDGTSRGPTLDHRTLADLDDVKLRLGFINSVGQQKGVDSLLVTDLVELSRNGAICDALLLGGDEDLRIGVQIAQSFGVRVHLLGIEPSRGSQSLQLRQETDTKQEISSSQVHTFLRLTPEPSLQNVLAMQPVNTAVTGLSIAAAVTEPASSVRADDPLEQGIESVLARISLSDLRELALVLTTSPVVPALYDGRMLASCRTALGRDLTIEEKKLARKRFVRRIRSSDQD